ncbi:ComEC/Rec2 family competence protein [Ilumatobacter sp.]|uniref:ComEC/Rec2 family competence protein n=1 Tax=Ilumatobacter sp. TaxID=1967498 RepID=UPI003AF5F82C
MPDVIRHPIGDRLVAGCAAVVAIGCWWHDVAVVVCSIVPIGLVCVRAEASVWRAVMVLLLLGGVATARADTAWSQLTPRQLGAFDGHVTLVDDPQPFARATRVLVEIEGERFEMWARGRAIRQRVATWRAGESVASSGQRRALKPERQERVAWQHVVGEFRIDWVSDVSPGSPVATASNRVRAALERAADELPADDGALFRGLVVGDDRDQPPEMIERFRASGLSHLTAVSGQNVSFVLMAAAPLLRVLRPAWRWVVTLGLILWFVSLTRFEPSIVRAGAMASLSATAFVLGRERSPTRLLWLAVTGLLLVDPLLVRSVGFWLSVGATAGVSSIGPRIARRLEALGWLATPIGVTLGAQVGVVIPAVLVFGRLPLVSVPANLLAVPVAGFVMLYGLPAGLLAGALPPIGPVVMFPCRVGVRWVDTISMLGARLEPGGAATWVGWGLLTVAGAGLMAAQRARSARPAEVGHADQGRDHRPRR